MPRSPASPARTCRCHTRPMLKNSRCLRSRTWSQRQRRSVTGEEPMATFDALHVPPTALEHGGVEVLRAAIVEGGLHVSLRRAFDDPQAGGMLIAGVARHAARIFAQETKLTEDEALQRIRAMLDAEMDAPTDPGTTTAISYTIERCHAGRYLAARAVGDHGEGQPRQVVQEGGRQGQARRRDR